MEGTQTSLLVDIYQYLERNKKLGVEREELKRKEIEAQSIANDVTSNDNSHVTIDNGTSLIDSIEETAEEATCGHVDVRNSKFIVIPVDDDTKNFQEEMNEESFQKEINEESSQEMSLNIEDNSLTPETEEEKVDSVQETNKLLNEPDKSEEGTLEYYLRSVGRL